MKSLAIKTALFRNGNTRLVPHTPRGRALHTVDWFLNGKPVLRNHDNPKLKLKDGCAC